MMRERACVCVCVRVCVCACVLDMGLLRGVKWRDICCCEVPWDEGGLGSLEVERRHCI